MNDTDSEITTEESESTDSESPDVPALTVRVVGAAGEPIEGAIVRGEGQPREGDGVVEFGGETDDEGSYTEEVDRGTYTIEIDHGEFEAATVDHDHDGDSEVTVELASSVAVAELSVSVVDPAGNPVDGATVDVDGQPHDVGIALEFGGETDEEGIYRETVYENTYSIVVDRDGYHPQTVEYVHDGAGGPTVELTPIEGGVPDADRITVVVVDEGGSPIEGAEVIGRGAPREADIPLQFRGETNSQGRHPDVIYHNDYRIQADHPEYTGAIVRHVHDGPADVVVELQSGPAEIPVAITALDPDTGGALEGATVRLRRTSGPDSRSVESVTRSDGTALFEVESGEYNVIVADGIETTHVVTDDSITVDDEPVTAQFEAVRRPDNCAVDVQVVDSETGSPIGGARFRVEATVENIDDVGLAYEEADESGTLRAETWCGQWDAAAGAEGYQPAETAAIDATATDSITVELDPHSTNDE